MLQGKKSNGFTILELVIVLIILVIISYSLIIFWPKQSIPANIAAYQVAGELRYTQAISMAMNQHYEFHYSGNSYYLTNDAGTRIIHPTTGTTANIALGSNLRFSSSGCIAFNGRGVPVSCADGSALNTATLAIANNVITVMTQTGYIGVNGT